MPRIVEELSLENTQLYVLDVTPRGVGVEFIYSYIVDSGSKILVVETGPDSTAREIAEFLEKKGIADKEIHVVVTHIHLDHGGGVGRLASLLGNATFYVHPRGYKHLVDPSRLWNASLQALGWIAEVYGEPLPTPREKLVETSDWQEIVLREGVTARILHTPGHASHHQSILLETRSKKILFTGDSAGMYSPKKGGLTPTTPPPFRYNQYLESLEKQASLKPDLLAFTHRGIGAGSLLEKHISQAKLWHKVIKRETEGSTHPDYKKILERILAVDPLTKSYVEETGMPSLVETLVLLSIQGFVEDIKREKGA